MNRQQQQKTHRGQLVITREERSGKVGKEGDQY